MPDDDVAIRSARNAYLVVILLLLAISVYQFVALDGVTTPVIGLWVAGAGAFYVSKYYYRYREGDEATTDSTGEEPAGGE